MKTTGIQNRPGVMSNPWIHALLIVVSLSLLFGRHWLKLWEMIGDQYIFNNDARAWVTATLPCSKTHTPPNTI